MSKRALRRHHRERIINWMRLNYGYGRRSFGSDEDRMWWVLQLWKHRASCSCFGCGNPRRHFGCGDSTRTLQELIQLVNEREGLLEVADPEPDDLD